MVDGSAVLPVDSPNTRLRWGTEQRLEFIEFRLFWEGGLNRSDITEQFGVSIPQEEHLSRPDRRA
jgi:hypothetical protein